MKTLLRSLLLAAAAGTGLLATAAQAQTFPNSTLDTWAIRSTAVPSGVEAPANWQTTDDLIAPVAPFPLPSSTNTVTKTTTARGGAFAAQLQTTNYLGLVDLPGLLLLGADYNGGDGGIPFTGRPANLQFYYRLSGPQAVADSAAVLVQLTRRVNGAFTLVAEGRYFIPALAAAYTLGTVPLRYVSGLAPDSAFVIIGSGFADTITPGTRLLVDDLAFTGTATATRDAALNAAFTAAPNPSPDGRFVLQGLAPALLAAPLTVLDATGRVVRRELGAAPAAARSLDLSALPVGVYTVQLLTTDGLVTRKLVR